MFDLLLRIEELFDLKIFQNNSLSSYKLVDEDFFFQAHEYCMTLLQTRYIVLMLNFFSSCNN